MSIDLYLRRSVYSGRVKHLLIVYHTKTGNTGRLARAARDGASCSEVGDVAVRFLLARDAGARDLLWANGVLLGTPEYLGYMSGAMKDFLDRTFYEVEGKLQPLPCAIFISAGNDGSGALRALRRIINGYRFEEVQEPVIARGPVTEEHLERCRELGMALAVGLEAGIY
jgi:multimeric flavodoxin WrbA